MLLFSINVSDVQCKHEMDVKSNLAFVCQTEIVVISRQVEKQLRLAYKAAEVNYKRSQATQHQNAVNETIYRT